MRQSAEPDLGRRRRRFLFARARQPVPPETRDGSPDGSQQDLEPDAPARDPQADYDREPAGLGGMAPSRIEPPGAACFPNARRPRGIETPQKTGGARGLSRGFGFR